MGLLRAGSNRLGRQMATFRALKRCLVVNMPIFHSTDVQIRLETRAVLRMYGA